MKTQYARLKDNGQLDRYNGRHVETDGVTVFNPSAETLAAAGYLPIPATDGTRPVIRWDVVGGALVPTYGDPEPPEPRKFSKMKMVAVLKAAELWDPVRAWIDEAGMTDLYLAAQDFSEGNEYFSAALREVTARLGITQERVEAILCASVAD